MVNFLNIVDSATNWDDIYNKLVTYNIDKDRSARELFENFCKYYYLVEPTVKNEYKNVWCFKEVPLKIKEKLNVGDREYGFDLVLEGYDDSLSVVQCKFRNDQSRNISWTKDKIANLFAEGDRADYFIVFTNVQGLDAHSLMKKSNRLKFVSLNDLLCLSPSTIKAMKDHHVHGTSKALSNVIKPREYQNKAIQRVIRGFKRYNRGQLILPYGAGKTLVALWIKEKLDIKRTLVLLPSLELLKQTKDQWAINSNKYFTSLYLRLFRKRY